MSVTPRSRSADKRYYGVAEGIVIDNNDPDKCRALWKRIRDVSIEVSDILKALGAEMAK